MVDEQTVIALRESAETVANLERRNAELQAKVKPQNTMAKAKASLTVMGDTDIPFYNRGRNYLIGYQDQSTTKKLSYHDRIKVVRWFYENDSIAGTVVNRMADMSITALRLRKKTKRNKEEVTPEVVAYYEAVIEQLRPFLKTVALEYLLHGMAIPDYTTMKIRGDKIAESLGRKRYMTIEKIWVRNPEHIVLKKRPTGMDRQVFLKVPNDEVSFIQNKGKRSDGTEDKEAYSYLVENFPAYVAAIQAGKTLFPLDTVRPIYRKLNSYDEYPIPFLQNALSSLQHKAYLKAMDKSIASRAIEAIRHVRVGNDDFPADDDDIVAVEDIVTQNSSSGERIFNLFTNHTVEIEWIFPPLDALLNEMKYAEPNSDIFLGLGFPRILTVGETAKSNAADNKIASLGPKATLDDMRDAIIEWLKRLFQELAELNNFTRIPDPYLAPIATVDMTALVQFAIEALNAGAISKDTVAQLYGTDYDTEAGQIETEIDMDVPSPDQLKMQKEQDFQMQTKQKDQQFQEKQSEVSHQRNLETIKAQPKPAAKPAAK